MSDPQGALEQALAGRYRIDRRLGAGGMATVGTTGGQVYGSANGGDSWSALVHDLPPVLSVEVQTIA